MKLSSKHITELQTLERIKTRLHDALIEVRQVPELLIVDEAEHTNLPTMIQKWIDKVEDRTHHIHTALQEIIEKQHPEDSLTSHEMTINNLRSVEELIHFIQSGNPVTYTFFWKHLPEKHGEISNYCLSNWYAASFTIDDTTYRSTEQYMMAQKALLFHDKEIYNKILAAKTPEEAKKLGKLVRNFRNDTWLQHRFDIVVQGNEAKFSQNAPLKNYLISTENTVLVEASPYDTIWGIGLSADDPDASNPHVWKGENVLGFALMEVRSRLHDKET